MDLLDSFGHGKKKGKAICLNAPEILQMSKVFQKNPTDFLDVLHREISGLKQEVKIKIIRNFFSGVRPIFIADKYHITTTTVHVYVYDLLPHLKKLYLELTQDPQ